MSEPRFFVPSLSAGASRVALSSEDAHHLVRVLRLGIGDIVRAFDGRGGEWRATVTTLARGAATIDVVEAVAPVSEPPVEVTLGIGILKGDQMDAVVRDATALGVASIVPLESAHVTVPERAWRSGAARERWRRVAIAAAKQCGRAVVPEVRSVMSLDECARSQSFDGTVMMVEPANAAVATADAIPRPRRALVLIGPEGGWSAEEVGWAKTHGARLMQLGPRTIRAELMPAVALSTLWTQWGWQ